MRCLGYSYDCNCHACDLRSRADHAARQQCPACEGDRDRCMDTIDRPSRCRVFTEQGELAEPVRLRIMTMGQAGPSVETDCTGAMTCQCRACTVERERIRPQGHGNANPFRRAA